MATMAEDEISDEQLAKLAAELVSQEQEDQEYLEEEDLGPDAESNGSVVTQFFKRFVVCTALCAVVKMVYPMVLVAISLDMFLRQKFMFQHFRKLFWNLRLLKPIKGSTS